jgi:hypothetical protein
MAVRSTACIIQINLNIFRDEFSQFWIKNGLSYVWQFHDLKGNAYMAEGKCEKIN